MNFGPPSFWSLLTHAATIFGIVVILWKAATKYGELDKQVKVNTERLTDLETISREQLSKGTLLTFETHQKICNGNVERMKDGIEEKIDGLGKMVDLKIEALKSTLLLAIGEKK